MEFNIELKSPRVCVWLDDDDAKLARDVAEKRHLRKGRHAYNTGYEGNDTDLQGAISEIAVCRLLKADFEPIYGGRDQGWDLVTPTKNFKVQVKSTPHFHRGVRLFAMPHEMQNSDFQVLCCVNTEGNYVEVVGLATTKRLWEQPLGRVRHGLPECRWLNENQLFPMPVQLA